MGWGRRKGRRGQGRKGGGREEGGEEGEGTGKRAHSFQQVPQSIVERTRERIGRQNLAFEHLVPVQFLANALPKNPDLHRLQVKPAVL